MLPLEQLPCLGKNLCAIQTVLPLEQCNTLTYSQELAVLASQRSLLEELNILITASKDELPLEHDHTVNRAC